MSSPLPKILSREIASPISCNADNTAKRLEFIEYLKNRRVKEIDEKVENIIKQRSLQSSGSPYGQLSDRYWTDVLYEFKVKQNVSFRERFSIEDEIPVSPRYSRRRSQVISLDWKVMLGRTANELIDESSFVDSVIVVGPAPEEIDHAIDMYQTKMVPNASIRPFHIKLEHQILFVQKSSPNIPDFSCIEDFFFPIGVTATITHEICQSYPIIEPGNWIPCDNGPPKDPHRFCFTLVGNFEIFGDSLFHVTCCTQIIQFKYKLSNEVILILSVPYSFGVVSRRALVYCWFKFIDSLIGYWLDSRSKLVNLTTIVLDKEYSCPLLLSSSLWLSRLSSSFISSVKTSSSQRSIEFSIWNRPCLNKINFTDARSSSEVNVLMDGCLSNMIITRCGRIDRNYKIESDLHLSIWSIPIFLSKISLDNLLMILACCLVEMSVIIICQDLSLLCASATAIQILLKPLNWVGPIISPCPDKLSGYLESPVPIIASVVSLPDGFKLLPSTCLVYPSSNIIQLHPSDMKQKLDFTLPLLSNLMSKLMPVYDGLNSLSSSSTTMYQLDPFALMSSKPTHPISLIIKQVKSLKMILMTYMKKIIVSSTLYLSCDSISRSHARRSSIGDDESTASSTFDVMSARLDSTGNQSRIDRETMLITTIGKSGLDFITKVSDSQMFSYFSHKRSDGGSFSSDNNKSGQAVRQSMSLMDDDVRPSEFDLDSSRSRCVFFPSNNNNRLSSFEDLSTPTARPHELQLHGLTDLFTMALSGSVIDETCVNKVQWCNGQCDGEMNTTNCTVICVEAWQKKMMMSKTSNKKKTASTMSRSTMIRLANCRRNYYKKVNAACVIQLFYRKKSIQCKSDQVNKKKLKNVIIIQKIWRQKLNRVHKRKQMIKKKLIEDKKSEPMPVPRSKSNLSSSSSTLLSSLSQPTSRPVVMKGFSLKVYNEVVNVTAPKKMITQQQVNDDDDGVKNSMSSLVQSQVPQLEPINPTNNININKPMEIDNDLDINTQHTDGIESARDEPESSLSSDNMSHWPNSLKVLWNGIQVSKFTSSGGRHDRWLKVNPLSRIITWGSDGDVQAVQQQENTSSTASKTSRRSSQAWLSLFANKNDLSSLPAPVKREGADDASDTSEATRRARKWWGGRRSEGDKGISIDDIVEVGRGISSGQARLAHEKKNVRQTNLVITIVTMGRCLDFEVSCEGDLHCMLETIMILLPNAIIDSLDGNNKNNI